MRSDNTKRNKKQKNKKACLVEAPSLSGSVILVCHTVHIITIWINKYYVKQQIIYFHYFNIPSVKCQSTPKLLILLLFFLSSFSGLFFTLIQRLRTSPGLWDGQAGPPEGQGSSCRCRRWHRRPASPAQPARTHRCHGLSASQAGGMPFAGCDRNDGLVSGTSDP